MFFGFKGNPHSVDRWNNSMARPICVYGNVMIIAITYQWYQLIVNTVEGYYLPISGIGRPCLFMTNNPMTITISTMKMIKNDRPTTAPVDKELDPATVWHS